MQTKINLLNNKLFIIGLTAILVIGMVGIGVWVATQTNDENDSNEEQVDAEGNPDEESVLQSATEDPVDYCPEDKDNSAAKNNFLERLDAGETEFSGIDLSYTRLAGLETGGDHINLSGADLSCAHFGRADLYEVNLSGADLSGAYFERADLSDADLSGADLSNGHFEAADFNYANISDADLTGADLERADLTRTNLSGANLTRADLTGADLNDTDLSGANLTWADLTGADLNDIDLTDANLTNAHLTRCTEVKP